MKRKHHILIILIILVFISVLICSIFLIQNRMDKTALYITVTDIVSDGNDKTIYMDFDNRTGHPVSFGWVGSCQLIVTTDTTIRSKSIMSAYKRIPYGNSSDYLTITDCPGTVQKIVLSDLRLLEDSLPAIKSSNVTIYDLDEQLTNVQVHFIGISQTTIIKILTKIFYIIFFAVIIFNIIKYFKQNKPLRKLFKNPSSSNVSSYKMHLHRGTDLYINEINQCISLMTRRSKEQSWDEVATQLRKILEYMVEGIHTTNQHSPWPQNSTLFSKIDMLYQDGLIAQKSHANYHMIRKACNPGVHINGTVKPAELFNAFEIMQEELNFYFKGNSERQPQ